VVADSSEHLIAGTHYPRDWTQFLQWFPDDDACLSFLEDLRWPDGFFCTRCGVVAEPLRLSRGRLMCRECRYQATVTAGTIFEKTRTPLTSWFAAAWYITNQKNGVSALGLKRVLGFGSYQTAWSMLHRLRRAMVRPDRDLLCGTVEVDEVFFGGPSRGTKAGRERVIQLEDPNLHAIVAVAVEIHHPRGFGRLRLRQVNDKSEKSLLPFICEEIQTGSTVRTDGSAAYRSVEKNGYKHHQIVHLGSEEQPHKTMPGVNRVASLLKRWLLGTLQGAVKTKQLDYYLDEFTFRFNRRSSRSRGLLFYRLLEQAVATKPATYRDIVNTTSSGWWS